MYFKSLKIIFFLNTVIILCATEEMEIHIKKELAAKKKSITNGKLPLETLRWQFEEANSITGLNKSEKDPPKAVSKSQLPKTVPNLSRIKRDTNPTVPSKEPPSDVLWKNEKIEIKNDKEKNTPEDGKKKKNVSSQEENLSDKVVDTINPQQDEKQENAEGGILVVSLGAGEDEVLASHLSWLFVEHGHHVTLLLYGEGPREEAFPDVAKIVTIGADKDDPLRSADGAMVGLTPEDASRGEWVSGKVVWSRLGACRRLVDVENILKAAKPKVMVTPLFLHDVCVLSLAERLKIPVVGILTSRIGAWWTWAQLGVLPSFSSVSVPLTSLGDGGLWARAANLGNHYAYMSSLRQHWQVRAVNTLSPSWDMLPLVSLYSNVRRLLLAWDPLVDPYGVPVPSAIPIGGFTGTLTGEMQKDILVPALLNRAGVVVVSAGTQEAWIGQAALAHLYGVLNTTSYTVLWKTVGTHLMPINATVNNETSTARFIFKNRIPLNEVLRHPRHRFMISTCGEHDVMAAVFFGSPMLCLPVTTDQMLASQELKRLGIAEMLLASEAITENLQQSIKRLSNERSFRLRARELAEELHDQPTTPSERLIFHVENVMRRPMSVRYKIFGSSLPLLQQTNADVYLIIIFLIFSFSSLIILVCVKFYPGLKKESKVKSD